MAKTPTINMLDAKIRLSSLVAQIESGELDGVILARDGRPAARLVPLAPKRKLTLGLAKRRIEMPEDVRASEPDILVLFGETDAPPA